MKTIAVIPAFNEAQRLRGVVEQTLHFVDAIVVVDDGSREPLAAALPINERVFCVRHIINLGKGAALNTGIQWAIQRNYEAAVFLDADGQHNPEEIPSLLAPIAAGQAKIVFGVRKFSREMPLVARLGNRLLTKSLQLLYQVRVDDTQSGYRAMDLSVWPKIVWFSPRYAVETEMIVNVGKHHVPFSQVPIATIYHDRYKGTTVIDGLRIMINMIAWKII